MKVRGFTVVGL